jgi:hypothetical protein
MSRRKVQRIDGMTSAVGAAAQPSMSSLDPTTSSAMICDDAPPLPLPSATPVGHTAGHAAAIVAASNEATDVGDATAPSPTQ